MLPGRRASVGSLFALIEEMNLLHHRLDVDDVTGSGRNALAENAGNLLRSDVPDHLGLGPGWLNDADGQWDTHVSQREV